MKNIFNNILKWFGIISLKLLGWKITGQFPENISKMVLIAAPHTSNWDLFFGILWTFASKAPVKYIIKMEAMFFPLNIFLYLLGAIPIIRNDKSKPSTVKLMGEYMSKREKLCLAISPEGTRKHVNNWKTGFYHIAENSGVPILPVYIDYSKKEIGSFPLFYPTGDIDKDIHYLRNLYKNRQGKIKKEKLD